MTRSEHEQAPEAPAVNGAERIPVAPVDELPAAEVKDVEAAVASEGGGCHAGATRMQADAKARPCASQQEAKTKRRGRQG